MKIENLSRREHQIMEILYRRGRASAAEIHEELPSPPSYSATRAMLSNLLRKGCIVNKADAGKYLYAPAKPRTRAASSAIKRLLDTFYAGSPSAAIAGILAANNGKLTREEADRLNALIQKASRDSIEDPADQNK